MGCTTGGASWAGSSVVVLGVRRMLEWTRSVQRHFSCVGWAQMMVSICHGDGKHDKHDTCQQPRRAGGGQTTTKYANGQAGQAGWRGRGASMPCLLAFVRKEGRAIGHVRSDTAEGAQAVQRYSCYAHRQTTKQKCVAHTHTHAQTHGIMNCTHRHVTCYNKLHTRTSHAHT